MLAIAYGKDQSESSQVHTPEYCYPAQGFAVTPTINGSIEYVGGKHSVVQLIATGMGGTRVEPITYWIVIGDHIVTKGQKQRRNARFYYGFNGFIPDGIFFRVSSIGRDTDHQFQIQVIKIQRPSGRRNQQSKSFFLKEK